MQLPKPSLKDPGGHIIGGLIVVVKIGVVTVDLQTHIALENNNKFMKKENIFDFFICILESVKFV